MGKQSLDIAFEKSLLLSKVLGEKDEKVLDSKVKYFNELYKTNKGKAIDEYLAFVEKLLSEGHQVGPHLKSIGAWVDESGVSHIDARKKYATILGRCYGEKSKELETELGLFSKDCYQAGEYDCCASIFEWKKTIQALDAFETYSLFDSYYKQGKFFDVYRVGSDELQRLLESSDQDRVAVFCLNLIEGCYWGNRGPDIVSIIESLKTSGRKVGFLYDYIDRNRDTYGRHAGYIYYGYLFSESLSDLIESSTRCFSNRGYIDGPFFYSTLKALKGYIEKWIKKNWSSINEEKGHRNNKNLYGEFCDLISTARKQMKICEEKKVKFGSELLDSCFYAIRDSQRVEFVSLQLVLLSYYVQYGFRPINSSDPFDFYPSIVNYYSTARGTKTNPSWIDFAIRLGDFTYRYSLALSQKLDQTEESVLTAAVKYFSDAESWNYKEKVYSDSEMRDHRINKYMAEAAISAEKHRIRKEKKAEKRDKILHRIIGFSFLFFALLLAGFTTANIVYSWHPNLTIGLIVGIVVFVVNFILNWTKPIIKTIADGVLLLSVIVMRLFMGPPFASIVITASASLCVCFLGNCLSSRLKDIYEKNAFDKINAVLALLSVIVILLLGFSFQWNVWQWIIGGGVAIALIVSEIVFRFDGSEYGAEIILVVVLLLNFILLAIFKENYHQFFEVLSIAIGVGAIIAIINGFATSEGVPLYCGIAILLLDTFSFIPWMSITLCANQAVLSVLLGYKWAVGQWIIGIAFGATIVSLPIIIYVRECFDEYCAILSAVISVVFLIANFVLYFIFKDRYYIIFQVMSVAIELGAIVSIILGIKEVESPVVVVGVIICLINLLSIIVWFSIMKSGSSDAFLVRRAVQEVQASSGQAVSTQVVSSPVVSEQKNVHQWWKWPLGIIGALALFAISFIPYGCSLSVVMFIVDFFLLKKYGYPGSFDIFFKCFTFGMAFSGIPGLFHDKTDKWTKICGILLTIICVIMIFNFDRFMTSIVSS